MIKLLVLYPQPTDSQQFDADYAQHLTLLHEKAQIPADQKPYTVTRFLGAPGEQPPFYQMFTLPFPSIDALQATMMTAAMQEVGADAARISSGGAPVMLIGQD